MRRLIAIISFLSISFAGFSLSAEEANALFMQGNQAYENGDFSAALEAYKQINDEFVSFEYFFNLGNAYYKTDHIAGAILYYEKAKKINPNDEDLKTNLQIANQRVKDKIEVLPSLGVEDFWHSITAESTLNKWSWASIIGLFLSALMFILFLYTKKGNIRRLHFFGGSVALLFAIICFGLANATDNRIAEHSEAIVFSPKVEVLNQPEGTQVEFVIHEGTKVRIRRVEENWMEVNIANGSVGWIKIEDCKEV